MKQNTGRWKEDLQKGTKNAIKKRQRRKKCRKSKRRQWKQEKKKKQEMRRLDATDDAADVRVTPTTEQTSIHGRSQKKRGKRGWENFRERWKSSCFSE